MLQPVDMKIQSMESIEDTRPSAGAQASGLNQDQKNNLRKVNLLGLTLPQMEAFFASIGQARFRATQVLKWIHQRKVTDFEQMTDIARTLRVQLHELAEVRVPQVAHEHVAADGTRKWVVQLEDGAQVEAVLIPDGDRRTLCVSSQVGCALGCTFCSTGKQGFQRDLTAAEIIGQVFLASLTDPQGAPRAVSNVVMMGMGEPLLNFTAVTAAVELMLDDRAYGLSKRRVTVSTSGLVPLMDRLGETLDVALAVSLHAPEDQLRDELVPVNKRYPLSELMRACQRYLQRHQSHEQGRRRITMEYVLLAGVNDQPSHARALVRLLRHVPSKINLIPFNPFPHAPYQRPKRETVLAFQKILLDAQYTCTIRTTRGDEIDAACGQLIGQVQDRTRRADRWKTSVAADREIIRSVQ